MGYFDIIASQVSAYRMHILFNLNSDSLDTTSSLIDVYYSILPNALQVGNVTLTKKPTKSILDFNASSRERTFKFSDTYQRELLYWVLDNLLICEQAFSRHLYSRHQMFDVLQSIMTVYRESVLFNMQNERPPVIAQYLIRIMNALLPDKRLMAQLPDVPVKTGSMFNSFFENKQREWNMTAFGLVENSIAKFIRMKMVQSQH